MRKYNIKNWTVFQLGSDVKKTPAFYIKPDKELLQFFRDNDFSVFCAILNTNSKYDLATSRKLIPAVVNKTSDVINRRANFFNKTKLYAITLKEAPWFGYPSKLGDVVFYGLKKTVVGPKTKDNLNDSNKHNGDDGNYGSDGGDGDDGDDKNKDNPSSNNLIKEIVGWVLIITLLITFTAFYTNMYKHAWKTRYFQKKV